MMLASQSEFGAGDREIDSRAHESGTFPGGPGHPLGRAVSSGEKTSIRRDVGGRALARGETVVESGDSRGPSGQPFGGIEGFEVQLDGR